MVTVLLYNGTEHKFDQADAVTFVSTVDLNTVWGFRGSEEWVEKLAYYAGKRKFGIDTKEIKDLVTSSKSLKDYQVEKGEIPQRANNGNSDK